VFVERKRGESPFFLGINNYYSTMKFFLLFLFLFSALSLINAQNTQRVIIHPESKIYLNGVSNINKFECELCNSEEPQILDLCYTGEELLAFDRNRYVIAVDNFSCENSHMTRDLKKTLKINKYPNMYLEIEQLTPGGGFEDGLVDLKIILAGTANTYCLPYSFNKVDVDTYKVEIKNDFTMTEFNIEPPTALLGLIKVKDQISIRIDLLIEFEQI